MAMSWQIEVTSLEETEALGRRLGHLLFAGAVVSLEGPLGAGKTHLVRALAQGLGIGDPRQVSSPTFVLIQEYEARLPIYHFDAYRLRSGQEFLDLGVHEYFAGQGACLVEWGDKVRDCLPREYLQIAIEIIGPSARRLLLVGHGAAYQDLIEKLKTALEREE